MALSKEDLRTIKNTAETDSKVFQQEKSSTKPNMLKRAIIISLIAIVVIVAGSLTINFANAKKPGQFDDFAKCLNDEGAIMYGANFCQYSHGQKGMFGNSFKYIDYQDYTEDPNVKVTPTWKINGAYYQNVQTFDRLATLTGCNFR
jgi:hypothetical protein